MKIAIIGVGGVGGYYGGLLARAGHDVTFVARGDQYNALKEKGLSVNAVDQKFHLFPVTVVENCAELQSPYVILLTVKAYDRDEVARQLAPVATDSTIIISLINGIDNAEAVQKLITKGSVYAGLAYVISTRTVPGTIEQTAGPRTIFFGDRENPANAELKEIEKVMRAAGILATASEDIDKDLWEKFLWITTFSGMTAVCRSSIGQIVNDAEAFNLYTRCLDEGLAIARALGVRINSDLRTKILAKSEHYRTEGSRSKSSLLVDLDNKRRTEIEVLNGTLVRLAKQLGVAAPFHEMIYHAVRTAENYQRSEH